MRARALAWTCVLWLSAVAWPTAARAQTDSQLRGFWVDTFNTRLNTPDDTASIVARAEEAHANSIFVQVRRRGDAWYLDAREPLPENVAIAEGFDPLLDLIARAHAARLEVHAFVVVGAIWNQSTLPANPTHVFNLHGFTAGGPHEAGTNWLTRTLVPDGTSTSFGGFRFGSDFWIDFGHPDAAAYTVNVLMHLVDRYELDGLHLDRIHYPEIAQNGQDAGSGASVGYNDVSLERFRRRYNLPAGSVPAPADAAWNDWRRDQVTALVRRLYLEALAIKPRLIVSAAVVAIGDAPVNEGAWAASDAHGRVFQDWRAWTEEGIVDLVVPMVYRAEHTQAGAESFDGWVAWTRTHQYGRHAAVGLGAYLNSVEGTVRQARRALEPAGTPLRWRRPLLARRAQCSGDQQSVRRFARYAVPRVRRCRCGPRYGPHDLGTADRAFDVEPRRLRPASPGADDALESLTGSRSRERRRRLR